MKIEPHLGAIKTISGEMPHPNGKIAVKYTNKKNKWDIDILMPHKTSGYLLWKGQRYDLQEGNNSFNL